VADFIEMGTIAKANRGMHYLLTVVDVLSKYGWVEPVKSKTGAAVTVAFEKALKRSDGHFPRKLQTDDGKEFYNKTFQALMKRVSRTLCCVPHIEVFHLNKLLIPNVQIGI